MSLCQSLFSALCLLQLVLSPAFLGVCSHEHLSVLFCSALPTAGSSHQAVSGVSALMSIVSSLCSLLCACYSAGSFTS
jgi:formate hydrogenlyase subunit 3/multisubunit Na+/H+ antiporter MnhD subunit